MSGCWPLEPSMIDHRIIVCDAAPRLASVYLRRGRKWQLLAGILLRFLEICVAFPVAGC